MLGVLVQHQLSRAIDDEEQCTWPSDLGAEIRSTFS